MLIILKKKKQKLSGNEKKIKKAIDALVSDEGGTCLIGLLRDIN